MACSNLPNNLGARNKNSVNELEKVGCHIVMLSRSLPFHSIGGMEIIAWDLARQFSRDGNKVTFLTTSIDGRGERFYAEGVDVIAIRDTPSGRYSEAWWRSSRAYFQQNLMGSVTSVLSVSSAAFGLLSLKKSLPDVPFVLQLHGSWRGEVISKWRTMKPKMWLASFYNMARFAKDPGCYRQFDLLIGVGDAVVRDLRRFPASFLLPQERIHLISNGVDTNLFFPDRSMRGTILSLFGWTEQHKVVISVSRLHAQKGVDLGLRGFARYAHRDGGARLLVVGDGPEKASLEQLAGDLGIADKVVFAGVASRNQVADYYRAADLMLFTTTHIEAGVPLNLMEALATGLPVIASDHLMDMAALDGVLTVNPRNEEEIAVAMGKALGGKSTMECRLPEEYTLSCCAREYLRVMGISAAAENQKKTKQGKGQQRDV